MNPTTGNTPTSLYRYFDAEGKLLYIGVTARGALRGHEHARTKAWWPSVASSTVEHFPTRQRALVQEAYEIRYYRPPHNVQHNTGGLPRQVGLRALESDPIGRRHLLGMKAREKHLVSAGLSQDGDPILRRHLLALQARQKELTSGS